MTRLLALAVLLLAAAADAQTDRYVTTAAELAAAIAASQPGDTVTMANGTWTDTAISFDTDGVEGDSITVRAETPGEVVLTGRSTLSIGGDYLKVDGLRFEGGALPDGTPVIQFRRSSSDLANHSRLTNTTIVDYNPPAVRTEYKWVSVYGRFNRVDHCYFAGKTNEGALLVVWLRDPPDDAPPTHRIDHNHFGPRPEFGDNGAETIRIGTSNRSMQDANVTVERNLFTETDGEIEVISNKSGGNVFRGNTFRRVRATLTLRHGNRAVVDGNFFFGEGISGTGGVRIIGEDHQVINNYFQDLTGTGYSAALSMVQGVEDSPLNRYFQVKRPLVANNTFVNTAQTFVIGVGSSSDQSLPPEDITLVNNVVQNLLNRAVVRTELEPVGTSTYAGNVVFGQPGSIPGTGFTLADPELQPDGDGEPGGRRRGPVVRPPRRLRGPAPRHGLPGRWGRRGLGRARLGWPAGALPGGPRVARRRRGRGATRSSGVPPRAQLPQPLQRLDAGLVHAASGVACALARVRHRRARGRDGARPRPGCRVARCDVP